MAKDSQGRKYNRIPEHTRVINEKRKVIREHVRSNPTRTCSKRGKKK